MAPGSERSRQAAPQDSAMMLVALGILAYAASMMTHEALGHGGYCIASGGHNVMLTAWWENCNFPSHAAPVIKAAGPGVQFGAGLLAWLMLHLFARSAIRLRCFFWLYMAFDLFISSGYVAFSGITNLEMPLKSSLGVSHLSCGAPALSCSDQWSTSCRCAQPRSSSSDLPASISQLDGFSAWSGFPMQLPVSSRAVPALSPRPWRMVPQRVWPGHRLPCPKHWDTGPCLV